MDNATLELLTRAEGLVRSWKPKPLGLGEDRFVAEACALLEATTSAHGCEPLICLLRMPADDRSEDVAKEVVAALAERPDCVEPLLRIRVGEADGPEDLRVDGRIFLVFGAMAVDDLVPALLEVLRGDADPSLRTEAFNQLVAVGPEVLPALERLRAHPTYGAVATRCCEKMKEHQFLPGCSGADAELVIGGIVDAYLSSETDGDATYALDQLSTQLRSGGLRPDDRALDPVRDHVRDCIEQFMDARDEEEERAALDELEVFVDACGDLGACIAQDEVGRVPVAPGTRRLHELAATFSARSSQQDDSEAGLVAAVLHQPASQLLELTRRSAYERALSSLRALLVSLSSPSPMLARLPSEIEELHRFEHWSRPAGLPALADEDRSRERWTRFALTILCNDAALEMKAVAALSLLGDRQALALLQLVADDPVGGDWVDLVISWDEELAEAEGSDLDTWASVDRPAGEGLAIDELLAGLATTDEAALEAGRAGGVDAGELADESMEPPEPMEPPGMASLDEALEEFVRRTEREPGG